MKEERDEYGFDAPFPVGHPARALLDVEQSTAPDVGERLPDFRLPDTAGQLIDYHASRGANKSVVIFYRSAIW